MNPYLFDESRRKNLLIKKEGEIESNLGELGWVMSYGRLSSNDFFFVFVQNFVSIIWYVHPQKYPA